uniref:Uncharacterized protein n=1 Tax=Anopheles dirus TaxID=7168 RepID=A0A182NMF0_9DIPT
MGRPQPPLNLPSLVTPRSPDTDVRSTPIRTWDTASDPCPAMAQPCTGVHTADSHHTKLSKASTQNKHANIPLQKSPSLTTKIHTTVASFGSHARRKSCSGFLLSKLSSVPNSQTASFPRSETIAGITTAGVDRIGV